MNVELDQYRITIRERSFVDILDLSLRVIRENAGPLVKVFFVGVAPMFVLNQWLVGGYSDEGLEPTVPVGQAFLSLLLIAFEAPLATAGATIYLGKAMFVRRAPLRAVFRDWWQSLGQLLLYQVVLRPICFHWTYLNEVILLDRNPIRRKSPEGRTTFSRARTVHRGESGDLFGRSILSFGLGTLLVLALCSSLNGLHTLLAGRLEWRPVMITFYLPSSVWIVVCFFTVVRFLGYLDLRIRREGWEVELAMRAERARLMRRWE